MSTVKANAHQIGQSLTASQNFTWYQPASPDGTVRLGNGNSGSVTDLVTLTSAGNLGIGTSSPAYKLDVRGVATAGNGTIVGGISYSTRAEIGAISNHNLGLIANNDTKAIIDTSGNFGLGVTPSGWASSWRAFQNVGGSLASSAGSFILLTNNSYSNGVNYIYTNNGYASQYIQNNSQHQWYTAPSGTAGNAISFTQAMTLDASGNLLVGTTSNNGLFTVNQPAANGNTGSFAATNASGPNYVLSLQSYASAANTAAFIRAFNNTSTLCFNVAGNGNVTNTNSSYGAISDRSLKENIVDATPKLVDLLKVKIRNFNLIGDSTKQIGVVAQELEEVFPAMVEEDKDGVKSVKYSVFTPMLIKAIQELSAELNDLKQKVNA